MFCLVAAEPEAADVIARNVKRSYPEWRFATCTHADELAAWEAERPDVVLMSRFLPGMSPEVLREISLLFPASRVVLLVGEEDESCRAFLRLAGRFGLENYVTGKLPGDRPYTVMAAVFYDRSQVVTEPKERYVREPHGPSEAYESEASEEERGFATRVKGTAGEVEGGNIPRKDRTYRKAAEKFGVRLGGTISDQKPEVRWLREEEGRRPVLGPSARQTQVGLEPEGLSAEDAGRGVLVLTAANKGGVGKTTAAVTVAIALASSRIDTVLMDLDFEGPDATAFFGCEAPGIEALSARRAAGRLVGQILRRTPQYPNLWVLPGPTDKSVPPEALFGRGELAGVVGELLRRFPVVIGDTPPQFWTRSWLREVFPMADLILAVVDQSVFSENDTREYAPYLLMMGVRPERIRIVLNKFSPRLHNARIVEQAFCAGFKKDVPRDVLPRVAATIPQDWDAHCLKGYRGEVAGLDDPKSQWHRLAQEIAALAGERYVPPEVKKKKGSLLELLRRR